MSLLPEYALEKVPMENVISSNAIENPIDYGIDFNTGILTGGLVEGLEAIKVWIYHALHIERYRFPIYSWQYGIELEQYIGKSYTQEYLQSDCRETVEDCLKANPHIKEIRDFAVELIGDAMKMSFHVITDIGGIDIDV